MTRLADLTIDYLSIQIEAGAEAIQLFDTWAGILDEATYRRHVLPSVQRIFEGIGGAVPRIYLVKDGAHLLGSLADTGADVLSLDWRIPLDQARQQLGDMPVQGNLDPGALLGSSDEIRRATLAVLNANGGRPGHIFNLGHGLIPQIPIEALQIMKDTILSHDAAATQDA
jgi:uroporphyrinogen decarboxylase